MPSPKTTNFTAFDFSKEEFFAATRFTQMNLMLIQTLYANTAAERLGLTMDVTKPHEFIQSEAALKGTMEAYEYLILLATETEVPQTGTEKESAEIQKSSAGSTNSQTERK